MAVRAAALCLLLAHQASPVLAQATAPTTLVVTEGGKYMLSPSLPIMCRCGSPSFSMMS